MSREDKNGVALRLLPVVVVAVAVGFQMWFVPIKVRV